MHSLIENDNYNHLKIFMIYFHIIIAKSARKIRTIQKDDYVWRITCIVLRLHLIIPIMNISDTQKKLISQILIFGRFFPRDSGLNRRQRDNGRRAFRIGHLRNCYTPINGVLWPPPYYSRYRKVVEMWETTVLWDDLFVVTRRVKRNLKGFQDVMRNRILYFFLFISKGLFEIVMSKLFL